MATTAVSGTPLVTTSDTQVYIYHSTNYVQQLSFLYSLCFIMGGPLVKKNFLQKNSHTSELLVQTLFSVSL